MTDNEKLIRLKLILDISETDSDALLGEYLAMAKDEILNWLYINSSIPEDVTEVPTRYEQVQIQAVIDGLSISGAEGQSNHSENGISRTFVYEDMVAYVHAHVYPYIGL